MRSAACPESAAYPEATLDQNPGDDVSARPSWLTILWHVQIYSPRSPEKTKLRHTRACALSIDTVNQIRPRDEAGDAAPHGDPAPIRLQRAAMPRSSKAVPERPEACQWWALSQLPACPARPRWRGEPLQGRHEPLSIGAYVAADLKDRRCLRERIKLNLGLESPESSYTGADAESSIPCVISHLPPDTK